LTIRAGSGACWRSATKPRWLDEVAFVAGVVFDERQALDEQCVGGLLVVHAQGPQQRKGGTLGKFAAAA
jgi:hypothetical protein